MTEQAQISVLRYPDSVRLRKEMYLMDKNHALFEIVDNAVDEYSAGYATAIAVAIIGNKVVVEDNGRGIPVTPHPDPEFAGLSQAEVAFTTLHAGGKFGDEKGYQTATGGLHGVGAACVNAVSSEMQLIIYTDGKKYQVDFEKGIIKTPLRVVGEADPDKTGTEVHFILDDEVWEDEQYDYKKIQKRLKQLAYLNPGLFIYFYLDVVDKNGKEIKLEEKYCFEDGLESYMNKLLKSKNSVSGIIHFSGQEDDILMDSAFSYTDGYNQEIYTFCNNISTEAGGDHLTGFKIGVANAVMKYMEENDLKNKTYIEPDDCREGIVGIVSVKVKDPKFEGQGKTKIKMNSVRTAVRRLVETEFYDYLCRNQEEAKKIIDKVLLAAKAREAAKRAREAVKNKQEILESSGLPGKLADCSSKNPEECEIFLVEGDSAGGSAKQARDRRTQAILPVFGKILNVEKTRQDQVLKNQKLQDVLKALGCGIGDKFDISRLRYHKIIIMTDADTDGHHIQCLYLTFFYRYLRELIEKGYVYIAMPPLYRVTKGKIVQYAYDDEELSKLDTEKAVITRYKGLGEMNPDQLWETTMNPETRKLVQITIEDAETADEYFSMLMGDNVGSRKEFIIENADYVDQEMLF